MNDGYDLNRFVLAQEDDYEQALSEITSGQKRSHWMWYIFPQLDGLAFSPTAKRYSIKSVEEARAYLEHPILGPRLLSARRQPSLSRAAPRRRSSALQMTSS